MEIHKFNKYLNLTRLHIQLGSLSRSVVIGFSLAGYLPSRIYFGRRRVLEEQLLH